MRYKGELELKAFVLREEKPHLITFLEQNKEVFKTHKFKNITLMKETWVNRFQSLLATKSPKFSEYKVKMLSRVGRDLWRELFQSNLDQLKDLPATPKNVLFMWGYIKMGNERISLTNFFAWASTTIENMKNSGNVLHMMSIRLLEKDSLSDLEKLLLKLSLSDIVDCIDPEIAATFKTQFDDETWIKFTTIEDIPLDDTIITTITTISDKITEIAQQQNRDILLGHISNQKNLIYTKAQKDVNDGLELQLYQIYEYITFNLPVWAKQSPPSESQIVTRVEEVLNIILLDTKLTTKSGENGSNSSKAIRTYNEKRFGSTFFSSSSSSSSISLSSSSSSSSSHVLLATQATQASSHTSHTSQIIQSSSYASSSNINTISYPSTQTTNLPRPRKIDLKLLAEDGQELSCCEFKAREDSRKLQRQQTKSLRLNKAVGVSLMKVGLYEDAPKRLYGMDWNGMKGYWYCLEDVDGQTIGKKIADLNIPDDIRLFGDRFKLTLLSLFKWKKFLVQQNDNLYVSKRLNTEYSSRSPSPSIFFSPRYND